MKRPFLSLALLLAFAAAALLGVLLYTEAGLQWIARQAQARLDGLSIERLSGRLAGPLDAAGVRYEGDGIRFAAERIALEWRPSRLLSGTLLVDSLETAGLSVTLAPAPPDAAPQRDEGAALRLPVAVRVDRLALQDAAITWGDRPPVLVDTLTLRLRAKGETLAFEALHLETASPLAVLDAEGRLPITGRGPLHLAARAQGEIGDRRIAGELEASGSTGGLQATAVFTEPLRAGVVAEADLEADTPRWRATAMIEPFALPALLPEARPLQFTTAEVDAQGDGGRIAGRARVSLRDEAFGEWAVVVDGGWDGMRWTVPHFLLADAAGPARIEGRASQEGDEATDLALDLRWDALAWPPRGEPRIAGPRGSAQLRGTPDAYRYRADGELHAAGLPPLTLQLAGRGDLQGTALEALAARWLDGDWNGAGTLAWSPALRWDLALDARGLDLAMLHPDVEGVLGGRLTMDGRYGEDLVIDARLDELEGELLGRPVRGRLHAALAQGELEVDEIALASGTAELLGRVRLGEEWRIDWTLRAPDLAELAPGWSGALQTRGTVDGPPQALRTRAELGAREVRYEDHRIAELALTADVDLAGDGRWQAEMTADGVRAGEVELGRVSLDTDGTTARHALALSMEHEDFSLIQKLSGSLADGRWEAVLDGGRLAQTDIGTWEQRRPAGLTVARDGAGLRAFCWGSEEAEICAAAGRSADAAWTGRLDWRDIDLRRLDPVLPLDMIDVAGTSAGSVEAAFADGRLDVRIDAEALDGTLRYALPQQTELQTLPYERAVLHAVADAQGLRGDFDLRFSATESVTATLDLPGYEPAAAAPAPEQAVSGRLQIDVGELSALALFIPDVHLGPGRAALGLDLSGTLGSPRLDGTADVAVSTVGVLRLGTRIEELRLQAHMRQNALELDGGGRMGGGDLRIRGSGRVEDADTWEGSLSFEGENLEAVRLPAAQITASPRITLSVRPHELLFDGTLTVPKAKLEPVRPEGGVPVSEDVVIVGAGAPAEERRPFRAHGRLELILGDEVAVQGSGFEGRLAGRLLLLVAREGDVTAQGEIRFVDGRYRAYGQNLVIKQGRVLYAGGPVDNPAIDVVASRTRGERGEIEVGVRVLGTAKLPAVELYSTPAMDDADVLSYLIIGRPLSEARAGEGPDLYQAATSVAIAGGEALAERIGERFDLVEISIEAGEENSDTALVLGRSLSPRLYVRYIQGLMQDTNAIQFRYELSDKWTIETESGTRTGAGADIIYTLER